VFVAIYFDEFRNYSENFGEFYHCKNLHFENNGEPGTHLGTLQGYLRR
jgi:hypothetical protein